MSEAFESVDGFGSSFLVMTVLFDSVSTNDTFTLQFKREESILRMSSLLSFRSRDSL